MLFEIFNSQNLTKFTEIAKFLYQVQVGSQKYRQEDILKVYSHVQLVAKIWLNLPVDHHHFGYVTKLTDQCFLHCHNFLLQFNGCQSEQPLSTLLLDIGNFKACICHNNNGNGCFLAHKLNRYIGNCNDQIAQKNNFANNNNMMDACISC